jgi:hypothetical protein
MGIFALSQNVLAYATFGFLVYFVPVPKHFENCRSGFILVLNFEKKCNSLTKTYLKNRYKIKFLKT